MGSLDEWLAAMARVSKLIEESKAAVDRGHDQVLAARERSRVLGSDELVTRLVETEARCGAQASLLQQAHELAGRIMADVAAAKHGRYATGSHTSGYENRPVGRVEGPAGAVVVNPPHSRHSLNKIGKSSRPQARNTVILPGTDVAGDMDAIRAGRARWDSGSGRYEVNGRLWGVEPNGTVFPDSGPGMVTLSRSQYQALKGVTQARGDRQSLPASLTRNPSISQADWDKAFEVYQHRQDHTPKEGQ